VHLCQKCHLSNLFKILNIGIDFKRFIPKKTATEKYSAAADAIKK